MNKFDKLQIASILLDLESLYTGNRSNNIASTSNMLRANVNKDGELNTDDLAKLALDQSFDSDPQGIMQKIQNNVSLHYDEIAKEFMDRNDAQGLIALQSMLSPNPDFKTFGNSLFAVMQKFMKHKEGGEIENGDDVLLVEIGDKTYRLVVFESEEEKEKGLMGIEELSSDEGALFDYSEDIQAEISFWMKDTYVPLDIVFVSPENKVISVKKGVPESEELLTEHNVAYVIEVNQNSGIKPGDEVYFKEEFDEEEKGVDIELNPEKLYILNEDGSVQHEIDPGVRIFSRRSTAVMIKKAKKAFESKSDVDYKDLGRYIFGELDRQTNRPEEYVEQ